MKKHSHFTMPFMILILILYPTHSYAQDKVALLFLTTKELSYDPIWKKEIERNLDKYNVYMISKYKSSNPFFAKFQSKKGFSANKVKVIQKLISNAIKNKDNKKFVILQQDAIPLKPLKQIYPIITKHNYSYINLHKDQTHPIPKLSDDAVWFSQLWSVIDRSVAETIAKDKQIIKIVSSSPSNYDAYIPTLLSTTNQIDSIIVQDLIYKSDAADVKINYGKVFGELNLARKYGFLFAIPTNSTLPIDALGKVIHKN